MKKRSNQLLREPLEAIKRMKLNEGKLTPYIRVDKSFLMEIVRQGEQLLRYVDKLEIELGINQDKPKNLKEIMEMAIKLSQVTNKKKNLCRQALLKTDFDFLKAKEILDTYE